MSSGIVFSLHSRFGINMEEASLLGTGLLLVFMMICRFLGGVLPSLVRSKRFLVSTVMISILAILGLFTGIAAFVVDCVIISGLALGTFSRSYFRSLSMRCPTNPTNCPDS